jgi:hypothetical protein
MAKVLFKGATRRRIQWHVMEKTYSYVAIPGKTLRVPDEQLMYVLSFGDFEVCKEEAEKNVEKKVTSKTVTNPSIEVSMIYTNTPAVTEQPASEAPVASEPEVTKEVVESVSEVAEEVTKEPEPEAVKKVSYDYTSIRKSELKKLCKERNLDTIGNRDDLIANLVAYDRNN